MEKLLVSVDFNGNKFAKKFNIPNEPGDRNFWLTPAEHGKFLLHCPSLPDITTEDIADCFGPEEQPPGLDEFLDAYLESEKGNKQKMRDLLERYERTKK